MSDLVPPLSELQSERARGSFWFLYLKNSATSVSPEEFWTQDEWTLGFFAPRIMTRETLDLDGFCPE